MGPPLGAHAGEHPDHPRHLSSWHAGAKLEFRGEHYRHTLMTPFFAPQASDLTGIGVPKIFLAGVGELMTEVRG